ncbi:MAG TPA: ribulose-phosphate 3-epimerase [Actinomycetales bacterium]|nr:ribulose-phosphate 3-epimerase [Actinomycetales bacterium]
MTIRISPSILSANFAHLGQELESISNADMVHVDVMDGHFVPNITMGPVVVEDVIRTSPVPIDAHLMVADPETWAPVYAEMGASSVTFHAEATNAPIRIARELRAMGARAGIAVNPFTPVEPLIEILPQIDMILVMTVEPGYGGQKFLNVTLEKIRRARRAIDNAGVDVWLQVDGGIAEDTIEIAADAGADMFVAGSAVFGHENAAERVDLLRQMLNREREQ